MAEKETEFMNPPTEETKAEPTTEPTAEPTAEQTKAEPKKEDKAEAKAEKKAEKKEKAEKPEKAEKVAVKKKNVLQKLASIQTTIKAPKNLRNSFGGYNYRNAEGILESVKPYLERENCLILLYDTVERIGDGADSRYYIKATAEFMDCESGDNIKTFAYARESISKKGMDDSQLTGSSSSYARKYALNGLLLLDDTKDADTDEFAKATGNGNQQNKGNSGKNNFSGKTETETPQTVPETSGEVW